MKNIVDRIGKPALLEQTAEECAELAHAVSKRRGGCGERTRRPKAPPSAGWPSARS